MAASSAPIHKITPLDVFALGTSSQKFVILLLLVGIAAAFVVLARKLSREKKLVGGSAYLSALRSGGPIIGCLGASFSMLTMTLGYASIRADIPLKALTPGFAEAFLQIGVGLLAGAVGVLCNWAVEARIDRQVLGV